MNQSYFSSGFNLIPLLLIIDRAMQLDKKHMPEYVGTMEATIEIQSLQIIGFLSMVRNKIALFCGVQSV